MNMQDILFKAKRIGYDEWVEGFIFATYEHTYIALPEYFDVDLYFSPKNIFIEVIPETVCRYTGLVDKNGAKVFEGDILQNKTTQCCVFWQERFSNWGLKNSRGAECYNLATFMSDKKRPAEIIGNIYDDLRWMEVNENEQV